MGMVCITLNTITRLHNPSRDSFTLSQVRPVTNAKSSSESGAFIELSTHLVSLHFEDADESFCFGRN